MEASQLQLFTGGKSKTPDFAIFYNIAIDNIAKIRKDKKDEKYKELAEYLWKAHMDKKNDSSYELTDADKTIIDKLIKKAKEIRAYHSHIWHDNKALVFDDTLRKFVTEKYERAIAAAFEQDAVATTQYEERLKDKKFNPDHKFDLFKYNNGEYSITKEGRIFFLCFFLTTGQMNAFLQQRKGSKRTDLPLYKVKHLVYTHYCHRDGASISGFHHEDSILNHMPDAARKQVLMARQAYKLITYLHDYPDYLANNETMPLLLPNENGDGLKKINTVQELLAFIKIQRLFVELNFETVFVRGDATNNKEAHEQKRTLCIKWAELPNYSFHINFDHLYRLTVLSLKYGEQELMQRLTTSMRKLAAHRMKLYELLKMNPADMQEADHQYLADPANQFLRGYRILTEKGVDFFESYLKDKTITAKKMEKLADMIRPGDQHPLADTGSIRTPEPIILYATDFIEKTKQKFRAGNRFMYYASKYLIDHDLVPDWYWEAEKFDPEKKKEFQKKINEKDGFRLCIENDHVTIGILKDDVPSADVHMREKYFQFSIGPRTMRYILSFHLLPAPQSINYFLKGNLENDMKKLTLNNGVETFSYLEQQFIPEYLKPDKADVAKQIEKAGNRIKHILNEWAAAMQGKALLKRAEKNRIIMECYRLFNWPTDEKGAIKFLRKDEYKNLSICHYSLGEDKTKFDYLYETVYHLNRRKPAIARKVQALLTDATSLDELMEMAIKEGGKIMENYKATIANLSDVPGKKKKAEIVNISRRLGIPIPAGLLHEEARAQLTAKRQKTLHVLPFAVHPMLALKYFAPDAYKADYKSLQHTPQQGNKIFNKIRTPQYIAGLHESHYDTQFAERMIARYETRATKANKKELEKWIGAINTTLTEDAILWYIAKKYLQQNHYTAKMGAELQQNNDKISKVANPNINTYQAELQQNNDGIHTVGSLHDEEIVMELPPASDKKNKETYYMAMKMHQLDDVMYGIDKDRLRKAALHYLLRHSQEKEYWQTTPAYEKKANDTPITYTGEKEHPIPYGTLREEMQLIARNGACLLGYLLDWERGIINETVKGKEDKEKQQFLLDAAIKDKNYAYIDFGKVITLAKELQTDMTSGSALNDYRNHLLHNDIPTECTYSYWARPDSEIGRLLRIYEPIHWKKDKSRYKQDGNNA